MDTVKISELVAATVVEAGNYLIINQAGTTKKADASIIVDLTAKAAWMIRNWAMAEAFEISAITYSANGNISAATLKWPDGTAGSISNLTEDAQGRITGLRFNYEAAYILLAIAYDNGNIDSVSYTPTNF